MEIYNKVLEEYQEDIKKGEYEIAQYLNSPERKVKTIEELSKFFILGYESGKGREHYPVNNVKIKEDAHGNIEFVQWDEI